jgi:DNA-binding transcriptional LysR family regulator
MNLFQLEYFTMLAETLSYTKASQKLHISQSTLSKLIINLEHILGTPLFIRNKRDVKLTPAGKVFYNEIKKTLISYDEAFQKVQNMEKETGGVINVGFLSTALIELLPQIINRFHEYYPTIQINPLDDTYSKIMDSLIREDIDLAFLPDLELAIPSTFAKKIVIQDSICAVVPVSHPFAQYDSIELSKLKDEPIISMDPKISQNDHLLIHNICMQQGFIPNVMYEANSLLNMLVMVDCRVGITIMAKHIQKFASNTVKFVPIKGLEKSFHVVCIYRHDANENIRKLLEIIDQDFSCSKEERV